MFVLWFSIDSACLAPTLLIRLPEPAQVPPAHLQHLSLLRSLLTHLQHLALPKPFPPLQTTGKKNYKHRSCL